MKGCEVVTIGDRIRKVRQMRGLTMAELGEKLGISAAAVSRYELGQRGVSFEMLTSIAKALNVSLWELTGYVTPEKSTSGVLNVISKYQAICSAVLEDKRVPDDVKALIEDELPADPLGALSALNLQASKVEYFVRSHRENPSLPVLMLASFSKLNEKGQQVAMERIEELTKIPDYQRTEGQPEDTQEAPEDK